MTTIPPGPTPLPQPETHKYRQVAESFGADPERYDRARPRYPHALIDRILTTSPGPDILDVGTGTGIVAHQLQAAGCKVLGVEPDPRMANWARQHGLDVDIATFENWDPADRTYDAIVSGQTWHWIDPNAGATKATQTLRPDGLLAVFWNADQAPSDLGEAFAAVYNRVMPDSLAARLWTTNSFDGYAGLSTKAADGIRRTGAFGEPEHWRFEWQQLYTRDEWLDQLPTQGDYSQFPPEKQEELLAGIGTAIDTVGGSFTMRYTTLAVTAVRTSAP